jgi:trans-aconitate methyltransferase
MKPNVILLDQSFQSDSPREMGRLWQQDPVEVLYPPAPVKWITDHITVKGKILKILYPQRN